MCKLSLLPFLVVSLLVVAFPASAAPPCPATQPGYVSDVTQILCIETASGANQGQITVLVTDSSSNFGDVALGPDGLLYFTDTIGARIFSFNPKSNAASATTVATLPNGTPNGLAFSSSNGFNNGDLYVNSSTGVWLIKGAACVGAGGASCSPSLPITPVKAISFSPSITAGGNAFDLMSTGENEAEVIVDQTHGQILQSPFTFPFAPQGNFGGFNSATVLASVSNLGKGVFANFCGDTLVASGNTIQRLSFSFAKNGKLTVSQSTYVNLGDTVQYFEVAADNTVLAATFSNGTGGVLWSVQPTKDASTQVPSCSAAPTVTQLASLKRALQAKTPPDLVANVANGVALGPTSVTITQSFVAGNNQSEVYNFGPHRLIVNYEQVHQPFTQSFTAVRSRPADIAFSSTVFPQSTVPINYAQLGGFAVQFVTSDATSGVFFPTNCDQSPGNYYLGPCPPDNLTIQLKSAYSTQDVLANPGGGGAVGDTLLTMPTAPITYTEDLTHDVWGADGGTTSGTTTNRYNSSYVEENQALKQNLNVTVQSPVASCGATTSPTCNPQFNIGQSVTFKLTFSPAPTLTPVARLSISKVELRADGTIQLDQTINVFSKNNSQTDNFFGCSTSLNQCNFNWDSSGASGAGPGLYQATIFSDSFSPVLVYLRMK
jgi:hypothetical protein